MPEQIKMVKRATFRFQQVAPVWWPGWVSSTVLYTDSPRKVTCQRGDKIDRKYFHCFFHPFAQSSPTAASFLRQKPSHIHIVLPWIDLSSMNRLFKIQTFFNSKIVKIKKLRNLQKAPNQWIFYQQRAVRSPNHWLWQTSHWETIREANNKRFGELMNAITITWLSNDKSFGELMNGIIITWLSNNKSFGGVNECYYYYLTFR